MVAFILHNLSYKLRRVFETQKSLWERLLFFVVLVWGFFKYKIVS